MLTVADMDLERFGRLFEALVVPHVNGWSKPSLFKGWKNRTRLSVSVTTHRVPFDGGDCDAQGTAYPEDSAMKAAQTLADDLGLEMSWADHEKGWGSFYFEDISTR